MFFDPFLGNYNYWCIGSSSSLLFGWVCSGHAFSVVCSMVKKACAQLSYWVILGQQYSWSCFKSFIYSKLHVGADNGSSGQLCSEHFLVMPLRPLGFWDTGFLLTIPGPTLFTIPWMREWKRKKHTKSSNRFILLANRFCKRDEHNWLNIYPAMKASHI